ncbi:MAG: NCS2 family permease, partial [Clostridia bacterium]|nr:NCS2 family permease [Clostridia bacterium]
MEKFFKLKERGTDVKTELVAGMTTFFAMVYILMVNANMFADPFGDGSNPLGVSYGAIYIATSISAVVGTILAGILANLPLAQASGMGLNAFFVYTVCIGFGLSYANALVLVLIEGIVFVLLTVTGLRKKIFEALPHAVRVAIPSGIGLFIALLGFQNAGIVVPDSSTAVDLASFNLLTQSWGDIMPMIVTIFTLLAIAIMSHKKIRGAVLIGIVGGMTLYYLLGL